MHENGHLELLEPCLWVLHFTVHVALKIDKLLENVSNVVFHFRAARSDVCVDVRLRRTRQGSSVWVPYPQPKAKVRLIAQELEALERTTH